MYDTKLSYIFLKSDTMMPYDSLFGEQTRFICETYDLKTPLKSGDINAQKQKILRQIDRKIRNSLY